MGKVFQVALRFTTSIDPGERLVYLQHELGMDRGWTAEQVGDQILWHMVQFMHLSEYGAGNRGGLKAESKVDVEKIAGNWKVVARRCHTMQNCPLREDGALK